MHSNIERAVPGTPALDERGAWRSSSATVLSRRSFLGVAAFASLGLGLARASSGATDLGGAWELVRAIVQSNAIGDVRNMSAMVPVRGLAWQRPRECHGAMLPGPIAEALDEMLLTLSPGQPLRIQTAEHRDTGAFSMTCAIGGGLRIAIASAPPSASYSATFRGSRGAIYVAEDTILVESVGLWREVRI